ncbi:unnamed protein product [Peniophora sp. CBMAI 1063]|nr:unnamed protein product [Peniophora sp. CBMAI 1063]
MRAFVILSFIFCLLVATTFAPLVTAAPLPQAAIETRCPRMECRIATTPSDASGDSSTTQVSGGQSAMADLIEGLILMLSSMKQLAAAAAAPSAQVSSSGVATTLSASAPTSTSIAAVDLASIATFTPANPTPTASQSAPAG